MKSKTKFEGVLVLCSLNFSGLSMGSQQVLECISLKTNIVFELHEVHCLSKMLVRNGVF